ncbi:DUF819 family protein [Lewinella sp. LCG006]|uniref:DUF819 family protein n=1 Tax=Lewinella sp. LCG006 TaxID=3231911 RepID=UPI003460088D
MLTISLLIVTVTVAAVFWLDRQTSAPIKKLLEWFPAILFAYVIPASITHLFDLDLASVQIHQWSKEFIIPLAILFVMSALSFRQLKIIGLRPVLLFVIGSLVIAILAPLLVLLSSLFSDQWTQLVLTEQYWKGLVPIVGGWIGGSTSQLVLKEVVECPEGLFLAILVLDNVLVNIWTILMFQMIKRSDQFNVFFGIEDQIQDFVPDEVDLGTSNRNSILMTSMICLLVMLATTFLVKAFLWKIVVLSVVGLLLGNFVRIWNHGLVLKAGGILIILIMAILGLKLNFGGFSLPLSIIGLVVIWLLLHYLFMMLTAKALKLHMAWVPIASMANLGGISTAPAVTAAYNEEWMPHAIVLAILSMVSGTTWGLLTIFLFRWMGG